MALDPKNAKVSVTEELLWKAPVDLAQRYVDLGLWPDEPLVRRLAQVARSDPDRTVLIDASGKTTYAALARDVAAAAAGLEKLGVGPGARVAIQLPNGRPFFVLHLALEALGAVSVPLPPIYRAHELGFILDLTGASLLAVPSTFRKFDYVEMVGGLRAGRPDLRAIVVDAAERELDAWAIRYEDVVRTPAPLPDGANPRALLEIAFTSGSTGEPKGVMHTANSVAADCLTIASTCGLGPDDVILIASTLGHQLGFALGVRLPILLGARVVLMESWNAEAAAKLIEAEGVTFTCTTPTFLVDLLEAKATEAARIPSLRSWVLAGAVVGRSLLDLAKKRIPHLAIAQVFGMTEVGAVIVNPPNARRDKAEMTGAAPPGVELRVLGHDGRDVANGSDGELVIRCPGLFSGYYRRRELTEASFTPDGFFRSGDQVRIDDDGFVQVTGRMKDLIKRGGESIAPPELEEVLIRHPKISAVAIVGYPDARLGERVCACVVPVRGSTVDLEEIVAWVANAGLAKQKWPERLELVDDLPLTSIGKVHKAALRALVVERGARPASKTTSATTGRG